MATPIASQLRQAWQLKGITLQQLCEEAALACSADSLSRKLSGGQPLTTREAEQLAQALDVRILFAPDRAARRAS